jgi:hypothetical protein
VSHQHRRLRLAAELGDNDIGKQVAIGDATGKLQGIIGGPGDRVTLAVLVGGARTWWPLEGGAAVEVWRDA